MRTAIVHYWLMNMRGGERVLERLCQLLPNADIFTLFYDPERVSPMLRTRNIQASFLNPLRSYYRSLLPVMPFALERFDLRGYDLVVSSESGPAKGVLTSSNTRHVCYCHTPMRYLWDLYPAYQRDMAGGRPKQIAMALAANYLRLWDYASAARVDEFVANSVNVQQRIWKAYRREARVVFPPVPVEEFYWKPPEDYYLIVSEMAPYKRLDYAISLLSRTGRRLKVVGEGQQAKYLRRLAGSNVEFCGRVPEHQLRRLYAGCRALILPGEEDFGMTSVEAQASGKAVVALGRGGALESVCASDPTTGILYDSPDDMSLLEALQQFELCEWMLKPTAIQTHAKRFSTAQFDSGMMAVLQEDGKPRPGKVECRP